MKAKAFINQTILAAAMTIAALATAHSTAWATTKTVTYKITDVSLNSKLEDYNIVFTRSGDAPFDASQTTYTANVPISSIGKTSGGNGYFSVLLADGFTLALSWGDGSDVNFPSNCIRPTADNKYITYTVSCPNANYYYVTHVFMTGMESSYQYGMLQPYPHLDERIDYDYDNVWNFSESYKSAASFGQITITYSDSPALSIFESDGEKAYKIKSKEDLRHLANYVNNGHNNCDGLTFRQTQDITCDDTYTPIGYYINSNDESSFRGTIDGSTLTMPASDVTVTATFTDQWGIADDADGSKEHPYIITTTAGLDLLAKMVNGTDGYTANNFEGKFFQLGDNITYTHKAANEAGADTENNYTAIGNKEHAFCGTFDGKDKTISGIRIYKGGTDNADSYQGLFGIIGNTARVEKIVLADTRITGHWYVGGIVGLKGGGIVENCHALGNVTIHAVQSTAINHGGIAGVNEGSISGCSSAANLTTTADNTNCTNYGGIVGWNNGGTVTGCLYLGNNLGGNKTVGAIVGYNDGSTVSNSYFTSTTITGKDSGGGNLDNANSAVGFNANSGTEANVGLAYLLTLGESITCAGNALTVGGQNVATEGQNVTLTNAATDAPSGYYCYFSVKDAAGNDVTKNTLSGNVLTMPAKAVTVSNAFRSTGQDVSVSYNDESDNMFSINAKALDGTENSLAAGWYFVGSDISYTKGITFSGNVNLILADGCTMNVGTSEKPIKSGGIISVNDLNNYYLITVYGQASGTGTLSVYTNGYGILASNITINGGHITVNTNGNDVHALYAFTGDVTINDGNVEATASGTGAYAIYAYNFNFNDGNVTTSAPNGKAIRASSYNFKWTNPTDRITIGSTGLYAGGNNNTTFYRDFTDGTTIYGGYLTSVDVINALAGKTFQPCLALADNDVNTDHILYNGTTIAVALQGRVLYKDGNWNTLCLPFNVMLTNSPLAGAEARMLSSASIEGTKLNLNFGDPVTELVAGTPYIIRWDKADGYVDNYAHNIVAPIFTGVTIDNTDRKYDSYNYPDIKTDARVRFIGTYNSETFTDEDKSILFLGGENKLYYPDGTATTTIGAFRAYFDITGGSGVKEFNLKFGEDDADGISLTPDPSPVGEGSNVGEGAIYNLAGQRLNKMQKGINIVNGKKIAIK